MEILIKAVFFVIINSSCFKSIPLTLICSQSTVETLEKGVKWGVNNVSDVVLVFLLLTLNIFHTFLNAHIKCQLG